MKAVNIKWDVDDTHDLETLPTEIVIPSGMEDEDEISNYLSDVTGFCHYGYNLTCNEEVSELCADVSIKMLLRDNETEEQARARLYQIFEDSLMTLADHSISFTVCRTQLN